MNTWTRYLERRASKGNTAQEKGMEYVNSSGLVRSWKKKSRDKGCNVRGTYATIWSFGDSIIIDGIHGDTTLILHVQPSIGAL